MNIYSIYLNSSQDTDKPIIVKDGFSFPAALFNFFWALYHKMWVLGGLLIFIHLMIIIIENYTSLNLVTYFQFITALIFGLFAQDLREYFLISSGFHLQDIVFASTPLEAELNFLRKHLSK